MTHVPQDEVTQETLEQWYEMSEQLKKLRASEMLLRKKIFGDKFPEPTEGTNTVELQGGWVLKGVYSLRRNVDAGSFNAIKDKLREMDVNPDLLVDWKPSLKKAVYNKLTDETRKLFDECLIIKPGSPTLTIALPAANKNDAV